MAATAYASLVSLLNTMEQIHTHPLLSTCFDINQNKYLAEKVNFFVDFVEQYSDADNIEVEDLVRRIADAAHEAERIEVHAADRICGGKGPSFLPDLQMIIEDMESIKDQVIKVKKSIGYIMPNYSSPSSSSSSPSSFPAATAETSTMVGFDGYMKQLLEDLIGHDVGRQIISITGMGGIGKTILARNLYENPNIIRNFIVRIWITVSQGCSARKIYLQALSCLRGCSIDKDTADDQQLSLELYRILFNRRYLIVLDDVWSVDIWDKIKFFFPENKNRSRIVVTTRESTLVDYFGSSAVAIKFLDKENSWKLFCEKAFPQECFPFELEQVGKEIVNKCRGLPLAIIVIGGLLGNSPRTEEYWEKIAKDKGLILNPEENKPSNILYLSYKFLPICLRSCFLHFGLYPENEYIDVPTFIKLWVAEGLIKVRRGQILEEVAESYLKDLVDRNLLSVRRLSPNKKLKTCYIHDLVRDLCIQIGKKENFFCVQRDIDGSRLYIDDHTTARFYPQENHASKTPSLRQPLIVCGQSPAPLKSRLLRVFSPDTGNLQHTLREVNLRFLRHEPSVGQHDILLPSSISLLWSLQTLIILANRKVVAPIEIWKMSQLRHVNIWKISLPPPPPPDLYVLPNLHTLKIVQNLIFSEEVCKRIPNIKELHIDYGFSKKNRQCSSYHLNNVGCFNKLESLEYSCNGLEYAGDSLRNIKFSSSLKELTLRYCKLAWSDMAAIGSLPHLQILSLLNNAIAGTEWIFVDEIFVSLKHLTIFHCGDVTKWIAESSNFPVLEELSVMHLLQLEEIPSGIGEIPTLQSIYLYCCSESANISAVEILEEQERLGNLGLRLTVKFRFKSNRANLFREEIQRLEFKCQNLAIICAYYLISSGEEDQFYSYFNFCY